jgi:hypothetical protein
MYYTIQDVQATKKIKVGWSQRTLRPQAAKGCGSQAGSSDGQANCPPTSDYQARSRARWNGLVGLVEASLACPGFRRLPYFQVDAT